MDLSPYGKDAVMPTPFPPALSLTELQRQELQALIRAGSTPQALVFRARIVLRAADPDHPYNLDIATELGCSRHTVAHWRGGYLEHGLAGLQDAPRSGRPRSFSPRSSVRCRLHRQQPAGRLRRDGHALEPR